MCNLYTMTATVDEMRRLFGGFEGDRGNLPAYDEIYPGRPAPVLRRKAARLMLEGRAVTNIRNLDSPFWRSALNNVERRCIVPVTRFCEWTAEPDPVTRRKRKIWFGLHPAEQENPLFAFAGLWRPGEGGPFMAFLTCAPNALVGEYHPKAMPVMLRAPDALRWLDEPRETACALAQPFADADMRRGGAGQDQGQEGRQKRSGRQESREKDQQGTRRVRRAGKAGGPSVGRRSPRGGRACRGRGDRRASDEQGQGAVFIEDGQVGR
jgi:putative SOS response-associated peptidase YedK